MYVATKFDVLFAQNWQKAITSYEVSTEIIKMLDKGGFKVICDSFFL